MKKYIVNGTSQLYHKNIQIVNNK